MAKETNTKTMRDAHARMAWVGLGSNLGASRRTLAAAASVLQGHSSVPLVRSSLWRTTPVECPPGSPEFLNAVVGLCAPSGETPESLLDTLQTLERRFGRQPRTQVNEPRRIDLDLLAFGQLVRSSPLLTVPHPRAHRRRFVLVPWCEIAPELVLPGQRKTLSQLLAGLPTGEGLLRLGDW